MPTKFCIQLKKKSSNNEAEYKTMIVGLKLLFMEREKFIDIIGDYQLVIN